MRIRIPRLMKSKLALASFLGMILVSSALLSQSSFADVISPRQQMNLDFTAEQVICKEGLVKVIKNTTDEASCVKASSAEKLAENGWAKSLSEKKIEEIQSKKIEKGQPAGTINKIATVKQLSQTVKSGPAGTSGYAYIFEACAESKTIRTPEIFVSSDSETKKIKLGSMLKPNSCYTSSVIIGAADPSSISATLLNKGGISAKITNLETQITDLKEKISQIKQKIPTSDSEEPNPENVTDITSMKKELKSLQDQLRRYLMALYVPPNSKAIDIEIPKSITGKPLETMSTELISVTEAVVKPESDNPDLKRFDVVFEACTGKDPVRLPIISVISDSAKMDVKLIERIIPNSCQVGVAKINAIDAESIATKISGNSSVSKQISNLEKYIDELQTNLANKRSDLGQLLSKQLDENTRVEAAKIALEISELRENLLEERTKLYGLMLKN